MVRDRVRVEPKLPAPVQTGPEVHSAFYKMGTLSFPWVRRLGRGVNHQAPPTAEVKNRVELLSHFPVCDFMAYLGITFTFTIEELTQRAMMWAYGRI